MLVPNWILKSKIIIDNSGMGEFPGGPPKQSRAYQEEAAGVVLLDHLQAELHHAGGLAELHGAVADLVTHHLQHKPAQWADVTGMEETEMCAHTYIYITDQSLPE